MAEKPDHIATTEYERWIRVVETPRIVERAYARLVASDHWPLISIVMPTCNTPQRFLHEAIDSVRRQHYPHWQLCIADDASSTPAIRSIIDAYAARDARIRAVYRDTNGGIAAATNTALTIADGDYIAFLDHDDILPDHALAEIAERLQNDAGIKLLYTDSDTIDKAGRRADPFFKPGWNYDLLLGQNYLNHLSVYRTELLCDLGGLREGFDGSQDYDLALRAVELLEPAEIAHIPDILYHWRNVAASASRSNLKVAVQAARAALTEHLSRTGQSGEVLAATGSIIHNRVAWQVPQPTPDFAVLVHGTDIALVNASMAAIGQVTRYTAMTIMPVFLTGNLDLVPTLACAAKKTGAQMVCFVAAGLAPLRPDWLATLAGQIGRPGIGLAGAKILSAAQDTLCGPMITGIRDARGRPSIAALRPGDGDSVNDYFARLALDQQATAVHGACFAITRELLQRTGGLDEQLSSLALLGARLSFAITALGQRVIWSAHAALRCLDDTTAHALTAPPADSEYTRFYQHYPSHPGIDPFYNPNLSADAANFSLPGRSRS